MYELNPELEKKLIKLARKDPVAYDIVMKKIEEIIDSDINHYKNLRYDLKECKRVHIGSFVLIFSAKDDIVYFLDYEHHDKIYR